MSAGYDKSKFLSFPAGFVDEFTCGICLNIYNEPMTTPCCRHSYCRQCIIQSLQMSSNPNTCPNDRKKLLSKDLMPADRTVTNILDKQEVYCDFKSYGCPQTVPLARLSSHLIQCGFDPNKAQDKCQQLLSEVTAAVDKIKPRVRRQEFEHMKERLTACQQEVRLMASQTAAQSVYVEPNTDAFKKKVMESAKSCVDNWEQIECNIAVKSVKKKVLKKCREAVRHSTDYNQLSQYLLDALNNQEYEWVVSVGPKGSAHTAVANFVDKMVVQFGDLSIALYSHHSDYDDDDDDDNYTDIGDDYFDYSDVLADEDDDDEEEWEDWRRHYH